MGRLLTDALGGNYFLGQRASLRDYEQLIEMWSTSQRPPLRIVPAVPVQCWVRSVCTDVVLNATVAALELLVPVGWALWNVIDRTELNRCWNAA